jgi:hypothetical protein
MNNRFKLGAALFAAAGTFAFAGAAPANAAACANGSVALSTLSPLAFSCDQGGFTFKLNSFSGFSGLDAITFQNPSPTQFRYSLQGNSVWTSGTKILNYSLTAPSGKLLSVHTASLSSAQITPGSGTFTVAGTNTATSTMTNNNTTAGAVSYPANLASDTFTATLSSISGGGVETVQSSYGVVDAPPTPAGPGPLPIFGAAAAFGFSRKVRNRIKAAA